MSKVLVTGAGGFIGGRCSVDDKEFNAKLTELLKDHPALRYRAGEHRPNAHPTECCSECRESWYNSAS